MNAPETISPRRARLLLIVVLFLACGWLLGRNASSRFAPQGGDSTTENPFPRRIPALELDGGIEWVNTAQPVTLASLRGRFVLLDFWTYCCINCIHTLPELKKLEQAFPNELVVIGVHSAKFEGEQDSQNIREAVLRYEIEHPVVNDAQMRIWQKYGARSWPTLVLIDPAGDAVWAARGERTFEELKALIEGGLPYYREQGLLKPGARPELRSDALASFKPLRFPGKVLADEKSNRLFIADSNHNRIVVTTLDGGLQHVIGSGEIGRDDGPFDMASFNHPQGMALVDEVLYVADTENHLLRKIDLTAEQVTTVAGTGKKGSAWPAGEEPAGGRLGLPITVRTRYVGLPLTTAIASPWALWAHGGDLYIAMAGTHQIWKMPLDESEIGPYAGNGNEAIGDGKLLPRMPYDTSYASFAQPSGLTSDGKQLFVADSEGSIIRTVPFDPVGESGSLVGPKGATLFEFGDVDGVGERVRFQHPLGVAWHDGKLCVADTYNNKIKQVDVARRSCVAIAGTGEPGRDDGNGADATFNEPSGLSIAGGQLFAADTNNHAIRVVELRAPYRVKTLEIAGLAPPDANGASQGVATDAAK
jgi:thiol-disulfide isomerase/thioredoxin